MVERVSEGRLARAHRRQELPIIWQRSASSEHPFAGGIQAEAEMLPATNAPEGFWLGAWLIGKTKGTVFSRGTHWDTIL